MKSIKQYAKRACLLRYGNRIFYIGAVRRAVAVEWFKYKLNPIVCGILAELADCRNCFRKKEFFFLGLNRAVRPVKSRPFISKEADIHLFATQYLAHPDAVLHIFFRSLHQSRVGAQELTLPAIPAYRAPHPGYAADRNVVRVKHVFQFLYINVAGLAKHLHSIVALPCKFCKRLLDWLYFPK